MCKLPLLVVAALVALGGCVSKNLPPTPREPEVSREAGPRPYKAMGEWYTPMADARGFQQEGLASWYGDKFHGRKTSSGEIYDMYAISAAHKTLPLGTYVRVTNLANGRSLDMRVNDRGPFVRGRIIDLSYAAALQLGVVGPGTAPVKIVALGTPVSESSQGGRRYMPADYYSGNFTFQVGAFTEQTNARRLVGQLSRRYHNAHMTTYFDGRRTFYRVRVGRSDSLEKAVAYEQTLIRDGFAQTFIVAE